MGVGFNGLNRSKESLVLEIFLVAKSMNRVERDSKLEEVLQQMLNKRLRRVHMHTAQLYFFFVMINNCCYLFVRCGANIMGCRISSKSVSRICITKSTSRIKVRIDEKFTRAIRTVMRR